ncbi:MAG TPA: hypothetical protein EYP33_01205 [Pyrodictium sp.]|nr:hypothetical protein [Pyrodictium sp.]
MIDCPRSFCPDDSYLRDLAASEQPKWCREPRYKPDKKYLERLQRWEEYCRNAYLRCLAEKRREGLDYKRARDACQVYELIPKLGVKVLCRLWHDLGMEKWGKRCGSARSYIELGRVLAALLCTEPVEGGPCTNETILGRDNCCKYLVDLHVVLDLMSKGIIRSPEDLEQWSQECGDIAQKVLKFAERYWNEMLFTITGGRR